MAEQTGRSLQLVGEELVKANTALTKFGSKRDLAADLKMSPTTITNFFAGRPVQRKQFHTICKKLKLDWQPDQTQPSPLKPENSELDELVQAVRTQIRPLIQERCGTMRVLDMSQPIGLGEIYTHVNILEKISGRTRRDLTELMPKADLGDFERFGLGVVREKRIPGLKAVEKYPKLMILGKPGAGKTTFLKHLAIECNGENFQAERVPLFITLKEFAETEGQPDLIAFMESLIHRCGRGLAAMAQSNPTTIQTILENGRALILLDGLDEVRETDASRVLRQIQRLADRYAGNAFIITCRIAAREYTFQQFTDVEVADFDDDQIADVSGKWFRCKQDGVKAERFLEKLKDNPRIRDLASSPLLLTLLCLVFEESGDFPANRAELYQEGVDILLKKWDAKRNIERDQIYKKLSLKRKEDLLSQLAWRTFAAGNYFFKQTDVERYIHEFIEHLPGASTDEDTLNLDSAAVLKAMEAQHGLLVERAHRIYSFSHLTFHEYFTARQIVSELYSQNIFKYITKKTWREVIVLSAQLSNNADSIISAIKLKADKIAMNKDLNNLLKWFNNSFLDIDIDKKANGITSKLFLFNVISYLSQIDYYEQLNCLHKEDDHYLSLFDDFIDEMVKIGIDHSLEISSNFNIDFDQISDLIKSFSIDFSLNFICSFFIQKVEEKVNDFQVDIIKCFELEFVDLSNKAYEELVKLEKELQEQTENKHILSLLIHKNFYEIYSNLDEEDIFSYCMNGDFNPFDKMIFDDFLNINQINKVIEDCVVYDWYEIAYELSNVILHNMFSQVGQQVEESIDIESFLDDFFFDEEISYEIAKEYEAKNDSFFENWKQKNGQDWINRLRSLMIQDCNLGYNWQSDDNHKEIVNQYLYANKLLIDCLNSDCYISRSVRQEIEETLLLPLSELEQRQTAQPST